MHEKNRKVIVSHSDDVRWFLSSNIAIRYPQQNKHPVGCETLLAWKCRPSFRCAIRVHQYVCACKITSLCAAATICATLVNIQIHRDRDTQTDDISTSLHE